MTIDENIKDGLNDLSKEDYKRMKEDVNEGIYSIVDAFLNIAVVWPVEAAVDSVDYMFRGVKEIYRRRGRHEY